VEGGEVEGRGEGRGRFAALVVEGGEVWEERRDADAVLRWWWR